MIFKSELFNLSTRIINHPSDFLKFFKKSLEITSAYDFLN